MVISLTKNTPLVLQIPLTDEQFFQLCQLNRDYHFERNNQGELIIMSPTGSETGNRNFNLIVQLGIWAEKNGTGLGFDSSTGFKLPNGSDRSPDAAWIKLERWNQLTLTQKTQFAPICPDFVVEIRSKTDSLKDLQAKLQEYIENGASLGWLIDRQNRCCYIYRPQTEVQCLNNPDTVSGGDVLPGFTLNMTKIW